MEGTPGNALPDRRGQAAPVTRTRGISTLWIWLLIGALVLSTLVLILVLLALG